MSLTPEQYQKKIQDKLRSLKIANIILPAAQNVQTLYRERLYGNGVDGDNTKIGAYSTKEMYASKKVFKNKGGFRAQGKKSKKPFANGNERKSMYLNQGYKQLRQVQGYESGYVNLHYSGDLFTDTSGLKIDGESVVVKVSRKINQQKISGLSDKYGKATFKHTKQERKIFAEDVTKRLKKYLE